MKARDAKPQEWKSAYNKYMTQKAVQDWRAGEKETYIVQPKEKTPWQKALDWIDNHQAEIALAIGIAVGVGAVLLTGGLALPALAVIAGAVALAGGTVAVGTVALNVHYDRQWNENLVRNIAIAGIAAGAVTGVGLLYNAVAMKGMAFCAANPATCGFAAPALKIVDAAEGLWLNAKLAYQTWQGDGAAAAETALDLHSEYTDGGMPGNSVIKELRDQFAELSQNAVYLIKNYGRNVIPLLLRHGDEALDIIRTYGNDGIALLQNYGGDAVDLIRHHGGDAVQILQTYGRDAIPILKAHGNDAIRVIALYKDEGVDFLRRAGTLGIDPTDVLDNPPLPNQTLEGWTLGIENPENPVNHPLVKLNLTEAELNNILTQSIKNPDSKVVVLGYGRDIIKPYYSLGDEINGSYLSLSPDEWAPFENAKANFWMDVNAPFIETAIENRKIFLFNVNKNTIIDPLNAGRFSLPELKLIELPSNDYVRVEFGQYDLFVPQELQESYLEYLSPSLLGE